MSAKNFQNSFVMAKKIKDTGLGKWLKAKAPKILESVGDLLPDNGGLGIVKNLLESEDKSLELLSYQFFAPNISTSEIHGIGSWNFSDFYYSIKFGQNRSSFPGKREIYKIHAQLF